MAAKEEPKMSLASLREKLKILQIQSNSNASGRVPDTPSSTSILRDVQLNSTPASVAAKGAALDQSVYIAGTPTMFLLRSLTFLLRFTVLYSPTASHRK